MKLTLSLTHQCNLACRYCYAGRTNKSDMSVETAKKCVDLALETLPEKNSLSVGFFGGEPLLRFDLIRRISDYARRKAQALKKSVVISVTTNGTRVTPEVVDFAVDHGVQLCFSLDGPADVHDRNRIYRGGRGSFDDVINGIERAQKRLIPIQVNAVFGPETVGDLPRSLEFFVESGIPSIHFSPDIMAVWPDRPGPLVQDAFAQVAERYIGCFQRGREVAVNLLDSKMLLFIKGGYDAADKCTMGDGEWGIAPSGNIYPCERFIGEDEDSPFCLGNIHTGLDAGRRCALRLRRGNHNLECPTCKLRKYCMNWCGCTNYFMSGQTDMTAPMMCALEQAAIQAARHVFSTLVNAGNALFTDHLYNYLDSEIHVRLGHNNNLTGGGCHAGQEKKEHDTQVEGGSFL
jgi:uncharacterized protein